MKRKFISLVLFFLGAMLSSPAQIFEVSPFFGYRFGGSFENSSGHSSDLEAGRAYGLALDYAPYDTDQMKLELFWSRQDSGLELAGESGLLHVDMPVDEFMLGGVYENGRGRLRETVSVLVGATLFSPEHADQLARFGLSAGVGVKYYLFRNLALRADFRGYCTVVESDSAFISTGGVTVVYFHGSALWQGEISGGLTFSF